MGQRTSLYEWHRANGGKMVDFSGWEMPVSYGSQIEEHHAVRQTAGMFDVSHMTVVDVSGAEAKPYLQHLLSNDVARLDGFLGKALYSGMLNDSGGVIDDLIVYFMGDDANGLAWYRAVVNCGTREKDLKWMELQAKKFIVKVKERIDLAVVSVQGPLAILCYRQVASKTLSLQMKTLKAFHAIQYDESFYARTGYTGEDGLEIIMPDTKVQTLWRILIKAGVKPCGLGARDTLRLEAGMNLYGHEMNSHISPLVANMERTIAWEPEERNFIGRNAIAAESRLGIKQKLVGLIMRDKGVLRQRQRVLLISNGLAEQVGEITSGTFSPTLGYSIALARVLAGLSMDFHSHCQVEIRNKLVRVELVSPCFVRNGRPLVC